MIVANLVESMISFTVLKQAYDLILRICSKLRIVDNLLPSSRDSYITDRRFLSTSLLRCRTTTLPFLHLLERQQATAVATTSPAQERTRLATTTAIATMERMLQIKTHTTTPTRKAHDSVVQAETEIVAATVHTTIRTQMVRLTTMMARAVLHTLRLEARSRCRRL